jgi:dolichol-phosphate mannosyltransferase
MAKNEVLIFLPTYNEAGHVPVILERIQATGVKADVVFLDDNSTDGTRDIIDGFAAEFENVFAIHRTGKLGIGSAHLDGIRYAYDRDYRILVTMDSDLVHKPEDIPAFLEAGDKADVVIGTRFEMKNSLAEWNLFRKTLTHLGHILTRLLLRHDFDSTGGFRAYRLDKIRREAFDLVKARDYEFFYTSLTILHLNGHSIAEIPIELPGRVYGHSKMQLTHMAKSVLLMVKLGIKCQLFRKSLLLEKHLEE